MEVSKDASEKAATYSARAYCVALVIASVFILLLMSGLVLLVCFVIDWNKRWSTYD